MEDEEEERGETESDCKVAGWDLGRVLWYVVCGI